jgi:hypothetical protein
MARDFSSFQVDLLAANLTKTNFGLPAFNTALHFFQQHYQSKVKLLSKSGQQLWLVSLSIKSQIKLADPIQ